MPGQPTFAELLDSALAASARVTLASSGTRPIGEPILFASFTAPNRRPAAAPARTRPSRRLTAHQREALSTFVLLGARLDETFTEKDLRSAFRSLARQYHPDRHPGTGPAELARLTRLFATISTHYQELLKTIG